MIKDFIVRESVVAQVAAWKELAGEWVAAFDNGDAENIAKLEDRGWKQEDARVMLDLVVRAEKELNEVLAEDLREREAAEEEDQDAFIKSKPALSALQTIMNDANMQAGYVISRDGLGLAAGNDGMSDLALDGAALASPGQKLFYSAFDEPGIRYLTEGARAVAYRMVHGYHPFMHGAPEFPLAEKSKIILVGDWGTGVGRAIKVAEAIRAELDADDGVERHVVHLGDIYFAGWKKESHDRFLIPWPVRKGEKGVHSWCLNGNHDMYCGGDGYFDDVLGDPRFAAQNKCSYFGLRNKHWHILGLDTAYDEWSLSNGQAAWALAQRQKHKDARGILLTHHQPHSAYEKNDPKKAGNVANEAAPLLKHGLTDAWLFGHAHECVVYKPLGFTFSDGSKGNLPLAVCLGHGGVPTKPVRTQPAGVEYVLSTVVKHGFEKFGTMGFGVLDLDGGKATLRCINENGEQHFSMKF